jgi:ABC-type hemin transport system ATPase subunit
MRNLNSARQTCGTISIWLVVTALVLVVLGSLFLLWQYDPWGPEVLLGDEPTSNLDPDSAKTLLKLLQNAHAAGSTVILASHDPEARSLATQVFELEAGRLK